MRRLLTCIGLVALTGCGGAVSAVASGDGLERATWIDERTVVLPRSAIQFDHRYVLRTQAARELGCPLTDVVLADPVRVADHDVVPVRACGVETYYARVETGAGAAFQNVGTDPLMGRPDRPGATSSTAPPSVPNDTPPAPAPASDPAGEASPEAPPNEPVTSEIQSAPIIE